MLCSVDVAVFIFGNNKKLYEYSSADMRELITRYTYVSPAPRTIQDIVSDTFSSTAAPTSTRAP